MNQKGLVHTIGVAAILVLVLAVGIYVAVSTPGITGAQTGFCGDGICDPGESCSTDCLSEVHCADGLTDNDEDGLVNCLDPDCSFDLACDLSNTCPNGIVDNLAEECDAPDDSACPGLCLRDCSCFFFNPEICNNGQDDDGDGDTDCEDSDCIFDDPACVDCGDGSCGEGESCPGDCRVEVHCGDGADNDGDGKLDCADEDCAGDGNCVPLPGEICDNGADDDGDGDTDCADEECSEVQVCSNPTCGNGIIDMGEQCEQDSDCPYAGQTCHSNCLCSWEEEVPECKPPFQPDPPQCEGGTEEPRNGTAFEAAVRDEKHINVPENSVIDLTGSPAAKLEGYPCKIEIGEGAVIKGSLNWETYDKIVVAEGATLDAGPYGHISLRTTEKEDLAGANIIAGGSVCIAPAKKVDLARSNTQSDQLNVVSGNKFDFDEANVFARIFLLRSLEEKGSMDDGNFNAAEKGVIRAEKKITGDGANFPGTGFIEVATPDQCDDFSGVVDKTNCEANFFDGGWCGDNIVDVDEVCDGTALAGATCTSIGLGSGTLRCNNVCSGHDTSGCAGATGFCGDGTCDAGEDNTNCPADCAPTGTFCGDGVRQSPNDAGTGGVSNDGFEDCDGSDLNRAVCTDFPGFIGGTLACSNICVYDFSGCATIEV